MSLKEAKINNLVDEKFTKGDGWTRPFQYLCYDLRVFCYCHFACHCNLSGTLPCPL